MNGLLEWLPLLLLLVTAGLLTGALAGAGLLTTSRHLIARVAPGARFSVLLALCALPLIVAALLVAISFAPSGLDALGIVADHCAHHLDHAFHLCFVHGAAPTAVWPLIIGAGLVALVLPTLFRELSGVFRTVRWTRRLKEVGHYDALSDTWQLDGPGLAFTLGFVKPSVFVSLEVGGALTPPHFDAVLAHEQAHVRRRDALLKSFARLCASMHFGWVRRELLAGLDLAAEQACDEVAATHVGDRLTVAEAIVRVARLTHGVPAPPALALGFGHADVEARVRGMLSASWWTPAIRHVAVPIGAATVVLALYYERLHHTFESILSYLI